MRQSGLFISFEGGEGAGKSTLIESLYQKLLSEKIPVIKIREPGGTSLGDAIRQVILHQKGFNISSLAETLLFLASRAQQIEETIKPHLQKGDVVLCDRFNDSTIAYQGVARGMGKELIEKLCKLVCQQVEPNCTFYLDLDPTDGLKRVHKMNKGWDRLENEKLEFHQKVRQGYLTLAEENKERICKIDASLSTSQVFDLAWKKFLTL